MVSYDESTHYNDWWSVKMVIIMCLMTMVNDSYISDIMVTRDIS